MSWDWQQVVALLCVAVALFVLGRRGWRLWKGTGPPGGACATCPAHDATGVPHSKPLVTLELQPPARSPAAGRSPSEGSNAR